LVSWKYRIAKLSFVKELKDNLLTPSRKGSYSCSGHSLFAERTITDWSVTLSEIIIITTTISMAP